MYKIVKTLAGNFEAYCTIQDGIESSTFETLADARNWLVGAAKAYNNAKLNKKSIKVFQEVEEIRVVEVPFKN